MYGSDASVIFAHATSLRANDGSRLSGRSGAARARSTQNLRDALGVTLDVLVLRQLAVEERGVTFELREPEISGAVDHGLEQLRDDVLSVRQVDPVHLHELRVAADVRDQQKDALGQNGAILTRTPARGAGYDGRPMSSSFKNVVVRAGRAGLMQRVSSGKHEWVADEPTALGGEDQGPDPYALLLASLGTCTSMTLRVYADRKGWPLEAITVHLEHDRIHAEDCRDCDTKVGKVDRIRRRLELEGALDEEQRARLVEIADMCPVHRTLTSTITVETTLVPRAS